MYPFRKPFDSSYVVSQFFGENPDVYATFDLAGHNGMDYGMPIGVAIKSVADGVVRYIGYDPEGYGNYIRIDHHIGDHDFQTLYAHSGQKPYFEQGDQVKEGQDIMSSGNEGFSTGPHLHFGLREIDKNGNTMNENNGYKGYIDPKDWFTNYVIVVQKYSIPSWAYDGVSWAVDHNVLDSYDSASKPVGQESFKYTLAEMLYRYYLHVGNGSTYSGFMSSGAWPEWANEGVNFCLAKDILDSSESVMQAVVQEAFKYTLAVMLYRYFLYVDLGEKYKGSYYPGAWPDWSSEGVSWCIQKKILDSPESVMQPVSEEAFKYTLSLMLYRYSHYI